MARYKKKYSLYSRKMKNGEEVFYYRTYDEDGVRTSGISTGKTTQTVAEAFCDNLIAEGTLTRTKDVTFEKYAENWWIWDKCDYLKRKLSRGNITRRYAETQLLFLTKYVLPEFGKKRLSTIKANLIEKWLMDLKDEGRLSVSSINHCYAVLRIMLNEAERLDYIKNNPIKKVLPLKETTKERKLITFEELKTLFDENTIEDVWYDEIYFAFNLTAASTGARLGELLGLQGEYVFQDYIAIHFSLDRKYGLKDTKTRESREVPIPRKTSYYLDRLKQKNGSGFIFSQDQGETPINYRSITRNYRQALMMIGIEEAEREKRNLTFHSWRYFFNTTLRGRVSDSKVRILTGHKTERMQEHYTSFSLENFQDVKTIQEELF